MHKGLQLLAADWTPPILSTICVQQLICHCCAFGRMLWLVVVYNYIFLNLRIYTVSKKKGATGFFAVTFTNIDEFSYFFVHNFARECQSHWHQKLSPHIRYVATIPCKSLRHKSNTFHTNISTLHMFISITFTETSIDETNKTQQKVRGSKFMFKMSTIHANTRIQTTTPLCNRWWFRW